jgi:hypothetical protein
MKVDGLAAVSWGYRVWGRGEILGDLWSKFDHLLDIQVSVTNIWK